MKVSILSFFAALLIIAVGCQQATTDTKDVVLKTELDSVSYALGVDIGNNIKTAGFEEISPMAAAKGFDDVFSGEETLIAKEDANTFIMAYFEKVKKLKGEKNLKEAEEFLKANAAKDGIVTTESGLQYKIITEGNGPIPTADSRVSVLYKGTLIDGREFDAATEESPAKFGVGGVIKGWTEALQLMPVGSKWMLYIHPDLAYGANPRPGGIIEANHMLIFEIELLEIIK